MDQKTPGLYLQSIAKAICLLKNSDRKNQMGLELFWNSLKKIPLSLLLRQGFFANSKLSIVCAVYFIFVIFQRFGTIRVFVNHDDIFKVMEF